MRLLTFFLSVGVCFGATNFLHAQSPEVLERADKQYELHAYRAAAKGYEQIVATRPTYDVWARLANCYRQINDLDKAAAAYQKAVQSTEIDPITHIEYAQTLAQLERYDEAKAQYQIFKQYDPDRAQKGIAAITFAQNAPASKTDFTLALSQYSTSGSDFGAAFLKNDVTFASTRTDLKRNKENANARNYEGIANNQLFIAPIEKMETKSKLDFLKTDFKNNYNEALASYSADGKFVVFTKNNFIEGDKITSESGVEMSIYTASVNQNGDWTNVRAFSHNQSSSVSGFATLSEDGNTLYFASNRAGGYGGYDLYLSYRRGDTWSEPQNLGNVVNSSGDEITPFFDGATLYFASNEHAGLGGFDLFQSQPQRGFWSAPENLGKGINSAADDYGLAYNVGATVGYFSSNRKGGKGKEDLYFLQRETQRATLTLRDALSKKIIPIEKKMLSVKTGTLNMGNLTIAKNGVASYEFTTPETATIEISRPGYRLQTYNFSTQMAENEVLLTAYLGEITANIDGYIGKLKRADNATPLAAVVVRATDQKKNATLETVTDSAGMFVLPLQKSADYLMHYTKEGFENLNKNIKTTAATKGNLGDIMLQPSALTASVTPAPTTFGSTTVRPTGSPTKTTPTTPTRPVTTTNTVAKGEAFAVQIAVLKSTAMIDLSQYDNLKSNGKVYAVPEGDKVKVRIGVYKTRVAAENALKKIRATNETAFVVDETNMEAVKNNLFTATTTPTTPVATPTPQGSNTNVNSPFLPAVPIPETYQIRIATLTKTNKFVDEKIEKMGKLVMRTEGKNTIVLLNGFKSLSEAKAAKLKVQDIGYKDARVVNGDLKVID